MKQKVGDGYRGTFRKSMRGGHGKSRINQYEGIFSKLNWSAMKGSRKIPKFSFFLPQEDFRTGICKLCMTKVKVFYTKAKNDPFLVNIEDKELHRKWIGNKGWHCVISKSENKEESETMKRLKNKPMKAKDTELDDCFYVEPE